MRKPLTTMLVAVVLMAAGSALAGEPRPDPRALEREAMGLLQSGKPKEALPLLQRAWDHGSRTPGVAYNAACAAALSGAQKEALNWLERAAELGFSDAAHLAKDPDLASVRAAPEFARLQQKIAANEAKQNAATLPAVRDELLQMVEVDQQARRALMVPPGKEREEAAQKVKGLDQKHTARMKELLKAHGWPTRTMVGERGAKAAWLLVQHADLDPAFQKECLALMEKAVKAKEAGAADWAYLVDRVLVAEGKPQRYGTQFHMVEGQLVPRPLEAPEEIDERRAGVGLGTLEEYKQQMARMYRR